MERSQWYIGSPNGVVLCVDQVEDGSLSGRMYHGYSTEAVEIRELDQLLFELERFFDSINFPYPWRPGDLHHPCTAPSEQQLAGADHMDGQG